MTKLSSIRLNLFLVVCVTCYCHIFKMAVCNSESFLKFVEEEEHFKFRILVKADIKVGTRRRLPFESDFTEAQAVVNEFGLAAAPSESSSCFEEG